MNPTKMMIKIIVFMICMAIIFPIANCTRPTLPEGSKEPTSSNLIVVNNSGSTLRLFAYDVFVADVPNMKHEYQEFSVPIRENQQVFLQVKKGDTLWRTWRIILDINPGNENKKTWFVDDKEPFEEDGEVSPDGEITFKYTPHYTDRDIRYNVDVFIGGKEGAPFVQIPPERTVTVGIRKNPNVYILAYRYWFSDQTSADDTVTSYWAENTKEVLIDNDSPKEFIDVLHYNKVKLIGFDEPNKNATIKIYNYTDNIIQIYMDGQPIDMDRYSINRKANKDFVISPGPHVFEVKRTDGTVILEKQIDFEEKAVFQWTIDADGDTLEVIAEEEHTEEEEG